jgi:hypothetical protein
MRLKGQCGRPVRLRPKFRSRSVVTARRLGVFQQLLVDQPIPLSIWVCQSSPRPKGRFPPRDGPNDLERNRCEATPIQAHRIVWRSCFQPIRGVDRPAQTRAQTAAAIAERARGRGALYVADDVEELREQPPSTACWLINPDRRWRDRMDLKRCRPTSQLVLSRPSQ